MANKGYNPYRDEKGRFASGPSTINKIVNNNFDLQQQQINRNKEIANTLNTQYELSKKGGKSKKSRIKGINSKIKSIEEHKEKLRNATIAELDRMENGWKNEIRTRYTEIEKDINILNKNKSERNKQRRNNPNYNKGGKYYGTYSRY